MRIVTSDELAVSLTPFDSARDTVLGAITTGSVERTTLDVALGRVVARDIHSAADVPAFDNAAMDGWAVAGHATRTGTTTPLSRIATGARLPDGADAVVPWEYARSNADESISCDPVAPGTFVRSAGHDVAAGQLLVSQGDRMSPQSLALLAACGIAELETIAPPRVAVLVSGDELVEPGSSPADGKVFDCNSTLVPALLSSCGATVGTIARVGDSEDATESALEALVSDHDMIVTTGGASVGERDWVRHCLERLGDIVLWRVAMQPGKPFALGSISERPVFVLPGNPGSVAACMHAFVAPAVRKFRGERPYPQTSAVALANEYTNESERTQLLPVRLTDNLAAPLWGHSSQALSHLVQADGYVIVAANTEITKHQPVTVEIL